MTNLDRHYLVRENLGRKSNQSGGKSSNNRPKKTSKVRKVALESLKEQKKGTKTRLCGDLTKFKAHLKSEVRISNQICVFCGKLACTKCAICDAALHNNPSSGKCKGHNCFLDYHSDACYGLAKNDSHLIRKRKADWIQPSELERKDNRNHILEMQGLKKKAPVVTPSERKTRSRTCQS